VVFASLGAIQIQSLFEGSMYQTEQLRLELLYFPLLAESQPRRFSTDELVKSLSAAA
jgi:hypothetical protein